MSTTLENDTNLAIGAKRRKPIKTNKVTQIQTVPEAEEPEEEEDAPTITTAVEAARVAQSESKSPDTLAEASMVGNNEVNNKLPNPLPPGMPQPPISSTSVVEPSPTDQMYCCPLCHETQATQKEFTTHIRGHNEVKPHNDPNDPTGQAKVYFCCLCGKMLSSFSSLDRHMLVHSGERPFSCDLCGQTFTTNGNMHRHKRTHGTRDNHGAQNGGVNGEKSRIGRKRKTNPNSEELPNLPKKPVEKDIKCPACNETFNSELNLDHHMYEVHPGQEVNCEQCNFTCPNYNYLKLHKTMFHFNHNSNGVGSASQGPPTQITIPTSIQSPNFEVRLKEPNNVLGHDSPPQIMVLPPTRPAMQLPPQVINAAAVAAAAEAARNAQVSQIQEPTKIESEPLKPEDPPEQSDLSDVQSMINITKTATLEKQDNSEDPEGSIEERNLSSHEGVVLIEDPVIRDMKLKGEFPCRLCPAVYPNLRALKGHNKEHLGKPPYICNVGACTYSSNDKSTLTRHMRTHTGEKPFECKLCSYGFTTKANCERHLKNKHGKTSRDAIRTSIVIHESAEDPERLTTTEDDEEQYRCKVCKQIFSSSAKVIAHAVKDHPAYSQDVDHIFEEVKKSSIARMLLEQDGAPSMVPRPVALIDQLKEPQSVEASIEPSEVPLDLSRPSRPASSDSSSQKPSNPSIYTNMPTLKMHGKIPMVPSEFTPPVLPTGFPYRQNMPFFLPFLPAANPALANFMNFMPNLDNLPVEIKQRLMVPNGGGASDLANFMHQEYLRKQSELKEQKEAAEALQHLSKKAPPPPIPTSTLEAIEKAASVAASLPSAAEKVGGSDSDSNYKMVIKNGVLMKKQKQRRYRTERPYSCNFCEARFTLRSNMERHIKQQHPQHWCQKPRGSRRNHTATVPVIAPQFRSGSSNGGQPLESSENQESENPEENDNKKDHQQELMIEDDDEEEEEEGFEVSDNGEDGSLIIDEPSTSNPQDTQDLASVSKLLTNTNQSFQKYFDQDDEEEVSSGSNTSPVERKKSAYSAAPHKIACPYCDRKFPWTSSLKRHILTHTGHKPYKCPECTLWFTTKSNCDRHLIRKHGNTAGANNNNSADAANSYTMRNVPDRPFKCKMCPSSSFSSPNNLRKHHITKHLNMEYKEDQDLDPEHLDEEDGDDEFSDCKDQQDHLASKFKCHICSTGFEIRALALSHMRSVHPEECASIEANNLEVQSVSNITNGNTNAKEGMECIFCPFICKTFLDLRRHVSKDHGVKYTCDICQKSFSFKKLLLRHKKKHDSGVSSGEDSEMEEFMINQQSSSSTPSKENNSASPIKKPKPSLMDTINKLSKQKGEKETLDNLFLKD